LTDFLEREKELRGAEEGDGRRSNYVERVIGGGRTRRPDEDLGGDIRRLNGDGPTDVGPIESLPWILRTPLQRSWKL
jgi:hypothetical protein